MELMFISKQANWLIARIMAYFYLSPTSSNIWQPFANPKIAIDIKYYIVIKDFPMLFCDLSIALREVNKWSWYILSFKYSYQFIIWFVPLSFKEKAYEKKVSSVIKINKNTLLVLN